MKYDDASWHSGGDFPTESPDEYGGVHIALFMKWCFTKGWAGSFHGEEQPEVLNKVLSGELSATDYFFEYCDGKFTDEDLTDQGNEFASQYYGDEGLYLSDYADKFGDLMYVASEAEHDFQELASLLEYRLTCGILTTEQAKPWWKFW